MRSYASRYARRSARPRRRAAPAAAARGPSRSRPASRARTACRRRAARRPARTRRRARTATSPACTTSSIRISSPSAKPNSNFVSARMMPRSERDRRRALVEPSVSSFSRSARPGPDQVARLLGRERQVVARGGLGGRREDRLGQPVGLRQPGGQRDAADRAGPPVVLPAGAASGSRAPRTPPGSPRRAAPAWPAPPASASSRERRGERATVGRDHVVGAPGPSSARTRTARDRSARGPCRGSASGRTTSKALIRSVATSSRSSPAS